MPRLLRAFADAMARGEQPRSQVLRRSLADMRTELAIRREADRDEFRPATPIAGSDHPGAEFPDPPAPRVRRDTPADSPSLQEVPA